MQKQQVQAQQVLATEKLAAPVEIDASLLDLVSGGAPKNTWSEPQALAFSVDAPKNTW
jgi:hypothetical protein